MTVHFSWNMLWLTILLPLIHDGVRDFAKDRLVGAFKVLAQGIQGAFKAFWTGHEVKLGSNGHQRLNSFQVGRLVQRVKDLEKNDKMRGKEIVKVKSDLLDCKLAHQECKSDQQNLIRQLAIKGIKL